MDGGFPYGDIIVIGAIAAFILLRYRSMLGEKSGRDVDAIKPAAPLDEFERVIQLPDREQKRTAKKESRPQKDYGSLTDTFSAMRAIDREFSPETFLEGARGAYEMVIEAYSERDHDTLKLLLAPNIYEGFKEALERDDAAGRRQKTTLIAIVKADFADAKLRGNTAILTVDFLSEQIVLVRNTEGELIEGNPSHQDAVEDRWVFERNLASNDPNWKVIET